MGGWAANGFVPCSLSPVWLLIIVFVAFAEQVAALNTKVHSNQKRTQTGKSLECVRAKCLCMFQSFETVLRTLWWWQLNCSCFSRESLSACQLVQPAENRGLVNGHIHVCSLDFRRKTITVDISWSSPRMTIWCSRTVLEWQWFLRQLWKWQWSTQVV